MTKNSRRLPLAQWQLEDSDRLKEIFQRKRSQLKLTQEKLAAELGDGVTQGAVSHFMNRRTALSLKAASVFARMLEVPVSEFSPTLAKELALMTLAIPPTDYGQLGDSPADGLKDARGTYMVAATGVSPLPANGDIEEDRYEFIPQYTAMAAAGTGHDNPHVEIHSTLAFKKEWLKAKGVKAENLQVIYADGESMWPTINDHDLLLVDRSKFEPVDNGVFVLQSATEGTIVKRLVQMPLGNWIMRSDNADKEIYGDRYFLRVEQNEHRIIGRVIWRGGDL